MDAARFDQSLKILANAAGRRDAMRSLGVVGMALLVGLGASDAVGAKKRKKRRRRKRRTTIQVRPCVEACGSHSGSGTCTQCLIGAAGPLRCSAGGVVSYCNLPCTSDDDCAGTPEVPFCITRIEDLITGESVLPCDSTGGRCSSDVPCLP